MDRDTSPHPSFLPQHGFGSDTNFDSLAKTNRFLFRVYTPKVRSPIESDGAPVFFLAPKFDGKFNSCPSSLEELISNDLGDCFIGRSGYDDAAGYLDFTRRPSSPYLSVSFSFGWAIWEALRRYKDGLKHNVEIAVIDAASVASSSVTLLHLLQTSPPAELPTDHYKWTRHAEETQSVLVHGFIPSSAVLSSISFATILSHLPLYFLHAEISHRDILPIDQLAWPSKHKLSYRQFCKEMATRYHDLPFEHRLRDATVGSVRLALAFLRPWFDEQVVLEPKGFDLAVSRITELAWAIAHWPDSKASSIRELAVAIRSMVRVLAEEIRLKRLGELVQLEEITKLHRVADELENVVRVYEQHVSNHVCPSPGPRPSLSRSPSFDDIGSFISSSPSNTVVHSLPGSPTALKISIPEALEELDEMELSALTSFKTPATSFPSLDPVNASEDPLLDAPQYTEPAREILDDTVSESSSHPSTPVSATFTDPTRHEADTRRSSMISTQSPATSVFELDVLAEKEEVEPSEILQGDPQPFYQPFTVPHTPLAESTTLPDVITISSLITGVLLGAFIALCVMGPQRRVVVVSHWSMT